MSYRRLDGDVLLRGVKALPSHDTITVAIRQAWRNSMPDNTELKQIGYKSVWLSGVFYKLFQYELAGRLLDDALSQVANDMMADKVYANDRDIEFKRTKKSLLKDYKEWREMLK